MSAVTTATDMMRMLADSGHRRSAKWHARRLVHLKRQRACLVCGSANPLWLEVHHKYPFHFVVELGRPDLELDERNLYTICDQHEDKHHLLVGHLGDYRSYNPKLEYTLAMTRGLLASQIQSLREWQTLAHTRPKPLPEMSPVERKELKTLLDALYPCA